MMNKWNHCPGVLKRRGCFTLLTGFSSVIVSLIIYLESADSVLFTMSSVIFICCLLRGCSLWDIVYGAVSGTCTGVTVSPMRRYKRVRITGRYGKEQTFLLSGQTTAQIGAQYCFYFEEFYLLYHFLCSVPPSLLCSRSSIYSFDRKPSGSSAVFCT